MDHILNPCPKCGHQARVVPAITRGKFIAECSEQIDCDEWPMTEPKDTEEAAAEAWNRGQWLQPSTPAAAAE